MESGPVPKTSLLAAAGTGGGLEAHPAIRATRAAARSPRPPSQAREPVLGRREEPSTSRVSFRPADGSTLRDVGFRITPAVYRRPLRPINTFRLLESRTEAISQRLQCSPSGVHFRSDFGARRSDLLPRGAGFISVFGRFFKPRPNRRSRIAASLRPKSPSISDLIRQPAFLYGGLVVLITAVLLTTIVGWGRTQPRIWVGEVATDSLVNPRSFKIQDREETKRQQNSARLAAPRLYQADGGVLEALRAKIAGLPVAVRSRLILDNVNPELRESFALTDASLSILQRYAGSEGPDATPSWREWTDEFIRRLWARKPLLETAEFQRFSTISNRRVLPPKATSDEIVTDSGGGTLPASNTEDPEGTSDPSNPDPGSTPPKIELADAVPINTAIDLIEEAIDTTVLATVVQLAKDSGFPSDPASIVATAALKPPAPTVVFDAPATEEAADLAAARIAAVEVDHPAGEVIYRRGEVIGPEDIATARLALSRAFSDGGFSAGWGQVPGWFLLSTVVVLMLAGHGVIFYPRIARSTSRLAVVVLLLAGATALGTAFAVVLPRLAPFGAGLAASILSIALALAYDRRIAIFASVLLAIALTVSTGQAPAATIAILATGAGFASLLASIPNRSAFVRATVISGGVAAVVFLAAGLAITPLAAEGSLLQISAGAVLAGAGALAAGFIMLGVMPTIERLFDITTGLALAELRDTRQPLLRELQARAPGTYNHSLAVASIAENAAEAIAADSRLVYVGALYHDVGKLNKPEYFIENQGGGDNKHDKLSPAMSLLVIIGHVKDGLELAQEYGLPKVLRHFIESHHGTSLVEYFFHAAKERAAHGGEEVEEFSYRYPGPKPRTREAAILLLCDGIESATRAMNDPTPSRIEALVRKISRGRLDDGQFGECELTFRDLQVIEDSIIKSLCAIYHSRIAYPGGREEKEEREPAPATATGSG